MIKKAHPQPQRGGTTQHKHLALALGVLVFVLLLIAPPIYWSSAVSAELLIYPASLLFTVLLGLQVWLWRKASNSLFDPYIIFFVAATLFNGGRITLEIFHLNIAGGILGEHFSGDTVLTTIYLVTLGLWSYHMGGLISACTSKSTVFVPGTVQLASDEKMRVTGWFLIATAAIPSFLIFKKAILSVMAYGYFVALFQQEAQTSLNATPELIAALLIPGTLMVAAVSKGRTLQLACTLTLIVIYTVAQLFLGSRALAAAAIIPYVWLWHRRIRSVPRVPVLIGGAVLVLVVAPFVGASRQFTGADRTSPGALLEALSSIDNPAVAIISEMGFTATTVAYTVDLIPTSRPFDYGASYAFGALTLLPNFFWPIHPTMAHGTPNMWLSWTVNPYQAARGGGIGYSFIAEAYYNAGWLGVIIAPGILGFLLAKLTFWSFAPEDVARIACTATILVFTLKYARSDCAEIVRGVVWYGIGPYFMVRGLSRRGWKRVRHYGQLSPVSSPV